MKNAIISILFCIVLSSCGHMSGDLPSDLPKVNNVNSMQGQKPWLVYSAGIANDSTKHYYYHKGDSMRWIAVKNGQVITDKKWVSK